MFEKQRRVVSQNIRLAGNDLAVWERELKSFNNVMTLAAVFKEIGFQAAFAAATMGAASALSTTAAAMRVGSWVARLGQASRAANIALKGLTVGARSEMQATAIAGLVSRSAAGVLVLMVRRTTGDFGDKKAMNFEGLPTALALTVLFAWAGKPGAPKPTMAPLKKLVEQLPGIAGAQGLAQGYGVTAAGLKTWMQQPENRAFMKDIRANAPAFQKAVQDLAEDTAKDFLIWAMKAEQQISQKMQLEIRKIDVASKIPWYGKVDYVGRLMTGMSNEQKLRQILTNISVYQAQMSFWSQAARRLSALEVSTKEAHALVR